MTYADIEGKKLSFSAGQYFDVKIEYVELTAVEFAEKMASFTANLQDLFTQSHRLEEGINDQIGQIRYE